MAEHALGDKKLQFFRAAEPLFERFGFRKTTVEAICREAGASKRTFYELFDDKADLFVQLIVHLATEEVAAWEASLPEGMGAVARMESYLDAYVEAGRRHPVFRLSLDDPEVHQRFVGCSMEKEFRPLLDTLTRIIADGVAGGEFRPVDPGAAAWIVDALLDSLYYILPGCYGERGAGDDPVLAAEARAFIINGLRARES